MKKHNLFPTTVWHEENGIPYELADELYQKAYECIKRYPSIDESSNQGGYHSPHFEWKNFHPQGIEIINKVIYKAIEQDFNVKSWWYNISGKGGWNMPHTHTGVDFAVVLYLTETDDLLTFVNNHPTLDDPMGYSPHTKKGDIVIFPAKLMHFVKQNEREEDRISISMNLRLCGN
tara:strand:- start:177 stop:701 length:525 start_codon:yes stop_codon:yes gene_type:complete